MPTKPTLTERVIYAVVPAAGLSRRMGRPKLLLPLGGKTVMAHLLETLHRPEIVCRAVVMRRDDEDLRMEVEHAGAWAIRPDEDPPEMRESVEIALASIEKRFSPRPQDGWLLVPADHPTLSSRVLDRVLSAWQSCTSQVLVPKWQGRRGHPTIFSWELAQEVPKIPSDCGLNWLVRSAGVSVEELPVADPAIFTDLDTPADYEALKRSFSGES